MTLNQYTFDKFKQPRQSEQLPEAAVSGLPCFAGYWVLVREFIFSLPS